LLRRGRPGRRLALLVLHLLHGFLRRDLCSAKRSSHSHCARASSLAGGNPSVDDSTAGTAVITTTISPGGGVCAQMYSPRQRLCRHAASEPALVVAGYRVNAFHRTTWGYEMLNDSATRFQRWLELCAPSDIHGAPMHGPHTGHMFSVAGVANEYWLYFTWSTAPSSADSITIMGRRWQWR
jgi:hypothetical protein